MAIQTRAKRKAKTRRLTLKEKFENLSLFDEYRIRFLEGLPIKRIEAKVLKKLQADSRVTTKRKTKRRKFSS